MYAVSLEGSRVFPSEGFGLGAVSSVKNSAEGGAVPKNPARPYYTNLA